MRVCVQISFCLFLHIQPEHAFPKWNFFAGPFTFESLLSHTRRELPHHRGFPLKNGDTGASSHIAPLVFDAHSVPHRAFSVCCFSFVYSSYFHAIRKRATRERAPTSQVFLFLTRKPATRERAPTSHRFVFDGARSVPHRTFSFFVRFCYVFFAIPMRCRKRATRERAPTSQVFVSRNRNAATREQALTSA